MDKTDTAINRAPAQITPESVIILPEGEAAVALDLETKETSAPALSRKARQKSQEHARLEARRVMQATAVNLELSEHIDLALAECILIITEKMPQASQIADLVSSLDADDRVALAEALMSVTGQKISVYNGRLIFARLCPDCGVYSRVVINAGKPSLDIRHDDKTETGCCGILEQDALLNQCLPVWRRLSGPALI